MTTYTEIALNLSVIGQKMQKIDIGQSVKLAAMHDVIFTVVAQNPDGSFAIEAKVNSVHLLSYGHVPQEMMRIVHVPD